MSLQVHSQVQSVVIRHLTNLIIIKSWRNLGVDNQSRPSETISFPLSHQVIHFKIRSRPNQVQRDFLSLHFHHSHQVHLLTIQELHLSKRGSIHWFGHRCCFKESIPTVNTSISLSFSYGFSFCLRATLPDSHFKEVVVTSR